MPRGGPDLSIAPGNPRLLLATELVVMALPFWWPGRAGAMTRFFRAFPSPTDSHLPAATTPRAAALLHPKAQA